MVNFQTPNENYYQLCKCIKSENSLKFDKIIDKEVVFIDKTAINNLFYQEISDIDENHLEEVTLYECQDKCSETDTHKYLITNYEESSNRLIECTSNHCSLVEVSDGIYVNYGKERTTNYLIQCSNKKCIPLTASEGFYINGGEDKSIKPLIHCIKANCKTVEVIDGHYIDNEIKENIITCQNNLCISKPGSTGQGHAYINNGHVKSIILCSEEEGCNAVDKSDDLILSNLYFIDGSDNEKIITCTSVKCQSSFGSSDTSSLDTDTYYLDSTNINGIISCNSEKKCSSQKVELGYYKNGSTEPTSKPYLECINGKCKEINPVNQCTKNTIGKLFSSQNNGKDEVHLCLNYFRKNPIYVTFGNLGNYLLKNEFKDNENNSSNNNSYSLMSIINKNSIILNYDYKTVPRRYIYTDINQKIIQKSDCSPLNINEFRRFNSNNIYLICRNSSGLCSTDIED